MQQRIEVLEADITTLDVDAIVNAANSALAPGGGVCGAIHRAAGPQLARECAAVGGCSAGEARITRGYNLKAKYVIHAVGPVWHGGGQGEERLLASAYASSLELARREGLDSVAFPAISTGVYGFPAGRAAEIAVSTIADFLGRHDRPARVILACFGAASAEAHRTALARSRS